MNKMVKVFEKIDIMFIINVMCWLLIVNMVKKVFIIWNKGVFGGWLILSLVVVVIYLL